MTSKSFSLLALLPTCLIGIFATGCNPSPEVTPAGSATGLPAVASTEIPTVTPTEAPFKLKVGLNPYTSYSPLFIAQDEGYFAEQGLEVEFVPFATGSDATSIPLLEQRQLDAAGQGPVAGLFNAIAVSNDIKIVVDRGYLAPDGCTYIAMLAKPEWIAANPTLTLDGIKGLRVSVDPKNFSAFMFEKVLSPAGIKLSDLETGDIKPADLMAAVETGVDFISTGEPWITRLTDTGKMAVWLKYQDVAPDMQFGFMIFGPSLLVDRPDIGKKFVTAYVKAIRKYNEGKTDRNIEIIAKYTKMEPELLKRTCLPTMRPSGNVSVETLLAYQEWAHALGVIETTVTAEQLWDPRFVEYANEQLGSATP
jgi:NitT/TauT family transport system substrate-binding protein